MGGSRIHCGPEIGPARSGTKTFTSEFFDRVGRFTTVPPMLDTSLTILSDNFLCYTKLKPVCVNLYLAPGTALGWAHRHHRHIIRH